MLMADMLVDKETAGLATALDALANGCPVIVTGAEGGAVLVMDGAKVTPDWINFMVTEARGLVGIAITARRAAELGLSLQPRRGRTDGPLYTQSIEARDGIETGISAVDRTRTILAAVNGDAGDIVTPGHIFPQIPSGDELGQSDLALRLVRKADGAKAAAICTILDAQGQAIGVSDAMGLADRHGLALVRADLVAQL